MKRLALLFATLVGVFFYKQVFLNEVFYCCDNLTIIIPSRKLLVDTITQGYFPIWNPYIFSGSPFLADINLALLTPLNILYFFLSPFSALTTSVIVSVFVGLIGMYMFSKHIGISTIASVISAIIFGFSGTMIVYTNNISMLQVAALLPWVLWSVDRYFLKPTPILLVIASLIITLQIFSGHPQLTYYTWLFTTAFVISRKKNISTLIHCGTKLVGLVFLLSGIQTIPFVEFVRNSTRVGRDYVYATSGSLNPIDLVRFVIPNVVGNLSNNFVIARLGSLYGYVGVIPLVFIFFVHRSHRLARFLLVSAASSLLLAFGSYTPFYSIVYAVIPGIASFRSPENFLLLYTFSVALLSGLGLDAWIARKSRQYVLFIAVGSLFVIGEILVGLTSHNIGQISYVPALQQLPKGVLNQWVELIRQNLIITGAMLASIGLFSYRIKNVLVLKVCMVCVIFVELFIFSRHNVVTISEKTVHGWVRSGASRAASLAPFDKNSERIFVDEHSYFYPKARGKPYMDLPQEMEWQFTILRPNLNMLYGVSSVDGYASMVNNTYASYFEKKNTDPTGITIPTDALLLRSFGVTKLIRTKNGQVEHISVNTNKPVLKPFDYDTRSVGIGAMLSLAGVVLLAVLIRSGLGGNTQSIKRLTKTKVRST